MRARIGLLIIALTLTLAGTPALPAAATVAAHPARGHAAAPSVLLKDADCGDFSSQSAAQHYFLAHGGPNSDPDDLDADGDGIACESNPCPCDYNTSGGGGGGGGGGAPQPKPKHVIRVHGITVGKNKFAAVGRIPTFKNGHVKVERRFKHHSWKAYKTTRTNRFGKLRQVGIGGPIGSCFEVVVPATAKYRLTTKTFTCIVKR